MRLAPVALATAVMLVICTVGIPARSSSFAIAAPQRVLVPHVEVSRAASTWSRRSRAIISAAIFLLFWREVFSPVVVRK